MDAHPGTASQCLCPNSADCTPTSLHLAVARRLVMTETGPLTAKRFGASFAESRKGEDPGDE